MFGITRAPAKAQTFLPISCSDFPVNMIPLDFQIFCTNFRIAFSFPTVLENLLFSIRSISEGWWVSFLAIETLF